MSVYNGEKYLKEAIQSILDQTFQDFEFIIIDDASTDSSCAITQSFNDQRIILKKNSVNHGLTESLNRGIFWSKGEFIARMDADDISIPERFEKQIQYFESHPEISVLRTSSYIIDNVGKHIETRPAAPNPMGLLNTGNRLIHGSVMFRKHITKEIGYYDYHFRYAQDYEFWLRASKQYQIRNMDEPLYKLRLHNETVGIKKAEEQALYVILAQRANGRRFISTTIPEYKTLTKPEKVAYHNMIIYNLIQGDDMLRAKREMSKLIKTAPLNLRNDLTWLAAIIGGKAGVFWLQNMYRQLRGQVNTR